MVFCMTTDIPTRRMTFHDDLTELPRHFAADGDLVASHFFALLSATFPAGEDGFVRSVRTFRDQVTDPELRRQVNGFIGQEAMHGREHHALNERLTELGYPTRRLEAAMDRMVRFRERVSSPELFLANTAALEHFTATMAEVALSGDDQGFRPDGVVGELLLWHSLEEAEHKAVAFDVFRAVGGPEKIRVRAMNIASLVSPIGLGIMLAWSLLHDRDTYKPWILIPSLIRFRKAPLMRRDVWRKLRAYTRPGFHPDDIDTSALVEEWRERFFGDDGTLNHRVVGGRAA